MKNMKHLLSKAIDNNEFVLYYQPQINIRTRKLIGIEALIRWNSPQLGIVTPDNFIPAAEQSRLIMKIDNWVLKTVCEQCRKWEDLKIRPEKVALNISSRQFENSKFITFVNKTLKETGAKANWLEFEITERSLIRNVEEAIKTLASLRKIGIKISLDDFGTGYSSLIYLRYFPIDKIKIDKTFMQDIPRSKENVAIVKTIIDLCRNTGAQAVAEGVETEEQLEVLIRYGCDEAQGYLFGKPMKVKDIENIIK